MSVTPLGREDEGIQEMLRDAGLEDALDLRSSLEELRALACSAAPEPRAELAALLSPAVPSLSQRRWSRQRRMAVVGAALVGAMSLGAGAVAASSEDFRQGVGESVSHISQTVGKIFLPSGQVPPQPEQATSTASAPAVPAPPATIPQPASDPSVAPTEPAPSAASSAAAGQGLKHAAEARGQSGELPGAAAASKPSLNPLPVVPTPPGEGPAQPSR